MSKFRFKIEKLPIIVMKEGDLFVVESPALDIATQGKTLKQAKSRFVELVEIFFEEIQEMGTLDEVLCSLGWIKQQSEWAPPSMIESTYQDIRMPAYA